MNRQAIRPHSFLFIAALCAILYGSFSFRTMNTKEMYLEQFKFIAISEMQRSGIPASIKMAQGMMESQAGRSELAMNANNHFGIKCKSTWNGATYLYIDDDKDTAGNLTHSCFRMYNSAEDSYVDHTEFIIGRSRYKELFSLSKFDFESWANGLKRCGYASDPLYAKKLIDLIKKYNLQSLDQEADPLAYDLYIKQKRSELLTVPKPVNVSIEKNLSKKSGKLHSKSKKKCKSRIFASPRLSGSK